MGGFFHTEPIKLGGEWYHPTVWSKKKAEAVRIAARVRKTTGKRARVLERKWPAPRGEKIRGWMVYVEGRTSNEEPRCKR